jgi:hypothetical protein
VTVQISIQVNTDARHTLECGYKTLLSMKIDSKKVTRSYMSKSLFFANVHWGSTLLTHHCLLTVEPIATNLSSMTISLDSDLAYASDGGQNIVAISDFLELFEKNLNLNTL